MAKTYLDASVVIPLVESTPDEQPRAAGRLAERVGRDAIYVASDLVRLECLVKPLARGDEALLNEFDAFLSSPLLLCVPLSRSVCERAALIRARYGFRTPDALHLAAAVEAGCELFATADKALQRFRDLVVVLVQLE